MKRHLYSRSYLRGPCGIEYCNLDPCHLSTHRSYVVGWRTQRPHDTNESNSNTPSPRSDFDRAITHVDRHITNGFLDLPYDTTNAVLFKSLIHPYLSELIFRVGRIFLPTVSPSSRQKNIVQGLVVSPVVMINVIAHSKVDQLMRSHSKTADRSAEIIYASTVQALRERLDDFKPCDSNWVLLLVVGITGLEFFVNGATNLRVHRVAMAKLVTMLGGIHAVSTNLDYILSSDRFIALCLGEYPLYRDLSPMFRPSRPPGKYGEAFLDLVGVVDSPVISFSLDQSCTIDQLEKAKIDFQTTHHGAGANLNIMPYITYMRDKISAENATLHAYYHENQVQKDDSFSIARLVSVSRCVVLGGHTAFYAVAFGDYYTIIRPMLATELRSVLERKNPDDWIRHYDILTWLLFVVAMIPRWDGHEWVMFELRLALLKKYKASAKVWPCPGWVLEEAENLRRFVWSDSTYGSDFLEVCKALTSLTF
jgi:hypothetical protein